MGYPRGCVESVEGPLLLAIFRDPWVIPFVDSYWEIVDRVKEFVLIAKGLIGEVFKGGRGN
ncbi:hypothetical protein GCM10007116_21770 [Sulfodiicoccus acidiphilus]|uniref:Uncharacterized protein n=1 Tax=Sulfodiicoccus acidiphilus TaxID=1670455 RepID=A0A830H1Z3_9CREN|nr:hypothetical protein [Sulfodiicoccus acidiphilus]GGU04779.1 hypothetical protein GCM10007116_21770 [Sulfodiicoccus acidiphilus]